MNNIYFLESDSQELIDIKIKELLKNNKFDNYSFITYDMEEINVSDAIIDLDTYSLFNEKKVVYCKNAIFLTTSKSEIDHNINILEKYLNNPSLDNILIISCNKTDGKKKIVKLLKEKANIIDMSFDMTKYIKKYIKDYKMDKDVIEYFLLNTGDDLPRINNELDKLLALKEDTKEITKKDIDLLVIKKMDSNIFELIDAIISKNKSKGLQIYNEMINYGEDIFKIFVSLANQIRLIYQVKVLKKLSNEEICDLLNLKNVRQVAALRYKIDKYTSRELLDYLHKLAIMDEELKTGKSIDKIVFPVFIANL